jgi:hypothetical protein
VPREGSAVAETRVEWTRVSSPWVRLRYRAKSFRMLAGMVGRPMDGGAANSFGVGPRHRGVKARR